MSTIKEKTQIEVSELEAMIREQPTAVPIESVAPKPIANGAAVAAYLAAMISMLSLGIVVFACEASPSFTVQVHALGKLWIPGAEGIGPYSGKETVMLISWLVSWPILHYLLRGKQLNGLVWLIVFLLGVGLSTTLIWPPVWHFFLGH
ncbi:MAG: hypothetical protein AB1489_31645 [Acidobacteriota bacterium]